MFTMKEIVTVKSLEEAYVLNQKRSNRILGGMLWLKMQKNAFQTGIDLSHLSLDQIEESQECFTIGCMCTLRSLETHTGLNTYFQGAFKECVRHIVGVQFRNSATVGGSVYGRYGFSDVLTCLLSLDTYVELYSKGIVSLQEFIHMPYDRDVLIHIIIKKDGRNVHYESLRLCATDFPILACSTAYKERQWYISIGARPSKAELVILPGIDQSEASLLKIADQAASSVSYGSNMRGSSEYRLQMAKVLLVRGMKKIAGGSNDAN